MYNFFKCIFQINIFVSSTFVKKVVNTSDQVNFISGGHDGRAGFAVNDL